MNIIKRLVKPVFEYAANLPLHIQLGHRVKGRVLLFLSPQYLNYGDHGIAMSELDFLRKAFPECEVVDLNYSFFEQWPEKTKEYVDPSDVIVITGGGFMGNIWPGNQKQVEKVIEMFPDNRIVFAPQTIYYQGVTADEDRKAFARLLRNHTDFHLFARDRNTCNVLQSMGFKEEMDYDFFPDFFILNQRYAKLPLDSKYGILCLRDDCEGVIDAASVERMVTQTANLPVRRLSMAQSGVEIPAWTRNLCVQYKLRQYAHAGIVVTDRLHAMLFAAFTGTPCIAIDNNSRKVSGVYEWIASLKYIRLVTNPIEIPAMMDELKPFQQNKTENRAAFMRNQEALLENMSEIFIRSVRGKRISMGA